MGTSNLVSAATLATLVAGCGVAEAQQASQGETLQEVIVTAEKRVENIENVPIAITAFSGDELKQLGMTEGYDLANQVPNMNIDKAFGDSSVRYFIRGVGTQDFGTLASSPIALYVDDVYQGSTIANSVELYDMQQVEVLEGPQGTLFGRNTTGGAISFISAHPTQTFQADVTGGYGNHGQRLAASMVNVPITPTLAARAAFTYSGQDAWITNIDPTGPQNNEDYSKVGGRLSFEWTPSNSLTAYLKGEYLKRTGSTITPHMVPLVGDTNSYGNPALPQDLINQSSGPSSDNFQTWDVTARLDWNIASFMKLISITAWQNAERLHEYELDGGTPFLIFNGSFFGNHDQFTQELRLVSDSQGPFRWQTGLFYYFARESAMTGAPTNFALFGGPPGYVGGDLWPENRKSNSEAAFGGVEYDLLSNLTGKAGLRYTQDEGSYAATHYSIQPYANYLNYLNPNPLADPNSVEIPGDSISAQKNWSKLTWDAGLIYHFSGNKMIYLNGSTGYRQGNFNTPGGSSPDQFSILEPETNLAFELGVKTTWLDGRLQFNAAAFNYDYRNMQVFSLEPVTTGGGLSSVENNAGKAVDRGGEIELKAIPAKDWLSTTEIGYVHAVFTEFDTFTQAGQPLSLAGNRFPRQPQWTASEALQYQLRLNNGASVVIATDWNYRSDYFVNPDNDANPRIPGRTIGNVRANYISLNDRWELGIWAKNITDKIYPIGGYRLGFANEDILYEGDPLTYGVTFELKF